MEKEKFKTPNPGMNYKDGKLYSFTKKRILVMKIDEYGPRAWEKTEEEPWFKVTGIPETMGSSAAQTIINTPPEDEYIHWCLKAEMEFLQKHVDRSIIEQMAKFSHNAFQMCGLAMRTKSGLGLIQSNPGIAYLVAMNNVFMGKCCKPWRRARSLVEKKRKVILEKAGFDGSKSVVRILGKTDSAFLSKKFIFLLRWLLKSRDDHVLKALRFLPKINGYVIDILGNEEKRQAISFSLLEELANSELPFAEAHRRNSLIRDMFNMSHLMQIPLPRNIRNMDQVARVHDQLAEMLNDGTYIPELKYYDFTPPTISDCVAESFKIEHIKNTFELQEWGKKQHNCVLSYNRRISEGKIKIFKITSKQEEATLSLIPEYEGGEVSYRIDQLRSTCNQPVKDETWRVVDLWLHPPNHYSKERTGFPMPEVVNEDFIIKPNYNLGFICNFNVHQFFSIKLEDVSDGEIFFYSLQQPESGVVGLRKVNGQWENVLARDVYGNDFKETTMNRIEQWLWENTPAGEARQLKFNFNASNQAIPIALPKELEQVI